MVSRFLWFSWVLQFQWFLGSYSSMVSQVLQFQWFPGYDFLHEGIAYNIYGYELR
jgi:hypothetical protein